MLKLYKYLYYRLYSWNLKTWGKEDLPQWNALFVVSFMMLLNVSVLLLVLQYFIGIEIFFMESTPKVEIVFVWFLTTTINYFIFIHRGRYKIITEELKRESIRQRKRNTSLLWLYVVLSFLMPLFVLELLFK